MKMPTLQEFVVQFIRENWKLLAVVGAVWVAFCLSIFFLVSKVVEAL